MKNLLQALGFSPKNNAKGCYIKKYRSVANYAINVDFEQGRIDYGDAITVHNEVAGHFSPTENWVVLE
jgi:hypothetical protein